MFSERMEQPNRDRGVGIESEARVQRSVARLMAADVCIPLGQQLTRLPPCCTWIKFDMSCWYEGTLAELDAVGGVGGETRHGNTIRC